MNCLRSLVGPELDPLQFDYQSCIGVDDAIIYLMHRSYLHLEDVGSAVRIMFFYLSSAFNTIQPTLFEGKLLRAGVDCHLATWIINYLSMTIQDLDIERVTTYKYLGVHLNNTLD